MSDPEDALAWQEREYDAADREREEEDAARYEPLPEVQFDQTSPAARAGFQLLKEVPK